MLQNVAYIFHQTVVKNVSVFISINKYLCTLQRFYKFPNICT